MMRRRCSLLGALLTIALCLTAGLAGAPAAQAVTGSPPVTVADDGGTVYAGSTAILSPLSNDTDPDGDALAICRLGTEQYKWIVAAFYDADLVIVTLPRAKPGSYTFTYYACDLSYLTAGTITVTVLEAPEIEVRQIASRPGKLRVTNPTPFAIRFAYGSLKEEEPDGIVAIRKGGSTVITVHRSVIVWIAVSRRGEFFAQGTVRGIELPKGDHLPGEGRVTLTDEEAKAWRSAG